MAIWDSMVEKPRTILSCLPNATEQLRATRRLFERKYYVGFICPQCKDFFPITDDEGNTLELKQARQLLASKPGKPLPAKENRVSEIEEKILVQLAQKRNGVTLDQLTSMLQRAEPFL
jgi:hypothetical protein